LQHSPFLISGSNSGLAATLIDICHWPIPGRMGLQLNEDLTAPGRLFYLLGADIDDHRVRAG
jgi:hypothetical protein